MTRIESAGIIGAGVIGSGWIARFLLNGIDVAVYDPSKEAVSYTHLTLPTILLV